MRASIERWKLWGADKKYPVLQIHCSKDELEAAKALQRLHDVCAGLRGLGFKQTLASFSNPDAIKDQGKVFTIDIGTLLSMVSEVAIDEAKRSFAVGWLRSLVDEVAKDRPKQKEVFTCRCGQSFKKEKQWKHHKKLCSVLARDFGLMLRAHESLKNLKHEKDKRYGKETGKDRRIREDHETHELRPKVSKKQGRKSKQREVHRRRQRRRT